MCKTLSYLLIFILMIPAFGWSQKSEKAAYAPGVVVFKLKPVSSSSYSNRIKSLELPESVAEKLKKKAGANSMYQPFAHTKDAKSSNQLLRQVSSSLDGIFKMELPEGVSVEEIVEMLKLQPEVQYAEPYYLPELLETPNDPLYPNQGYLPVIKAPQAWAIQKGSKDIIIGILDSGVDFNHPDLQDNLHLNVNDPINGVDDDGDGYIDNYRGWDFANRDNNPTADRSGHGTRVAGICAASTNNALGIAGTGYNTKYMPIKIFTSTTNAFANGYEAIAYAANMGCHVINLSWGVGGSPSEYIQDIINYAVLEKDVVVVAAAGNTKAEIDFYPASYTNVLSVSASDNYDNKADWSTWSRYVDIVAPGDAYSTFNGGSYAYGTGTSFSAPQVAGAAALVRASYPELNAQQVMEVLRMGADDIYHIGTNINFKDRLGRGRLNMEKALLGPTSPAVRMNKYAYTNGIGNYAFHNDTVKLWMDFTNYLSPSSDVKVKLISESAYAVMLDEEVSLGPLNTMQKVSSEAKPFRFRLTSDLPALALISFKLEFSTADGYTDYQYFTFRTSGEYIDFKIGDLTLTIASNGNLGYNYDYNLQGLGLRYQNAPLAHNMGLLIAQNTKAVANNVVERTLPARRNLDFRTLQRLRLYSNSTAHVDARSSFEVITADSVRLNLLVDQKILGWNSEAHGASIVLEYRITNRADTAYSNLNVALFSDFNLNDFFLNRAKWDASHRLGYTYDETTNRYAGIVLISDQTMLHHALDLNTREGNTAEISTTLSRKQKWEFISKGLNKTAAGVNGKGNDVGQFLGGTIKNLAPKHAQKVVFAMITASSLAELQAASAKARENYNTYINAAALPLANTESCAGESLTLTPKAGAQYRYFSQINSLDPVAEGETINFITPGKDTTFYASNISSGWPGELERINIAVNPAVAADFTMSADKVILNAGLNQTVTFTGSANLVTSWSWEFGDGQTSTLQNPSITFTEAGTYQVKAWATSDKGCVRLISHTLKVYSKEEAVSLSDMLVCENTSATIQDQNNRPINVYGDAEKSTLLFSGLVFTSDPLAVSQTYYISAGSGPSESDLSTITATVLTADLAEFELPLEPQPLLWGQAVVPFSSTSKVATEWFWNFGDGQSSTEQHPSHAYTQAGTYTVTLVTRYKSGCEQSMTKQLVISPNKTNVKSPATLQFYPNPTAGAVTILSPASIHTKAKLVVLNIAGKVIVEEAINPSQQIQLDLSIYSPGVYVVRINSENHIWQGRILRK